MSSLAEILDAIAVKSRGVSGIVGASGAGVTAGVDGMPLELPGVPYAMCMPGESDTEQGRVTTTDDQAEVRIYVPAGSLPASGAILAAMPDRFEAAWRTDRDLGGLVVDSWYAGHGKIEREEWGSVAYLVMPIRIGILRIVTGTVAS